MKKIFVTVLMAQVYMSCTESTQQNINSVNVEKKDTQSVITNAGFKNIAFDSKKDLVCGMPVTAGITDTIRYKGKVYGFCSKECKDEFSKNPDLYLTAK